MSALFGKQMRLLPIIRTSFSTVAVRQLVQSPHRIIYLKRNCVPVCSRTYSGDAFLNYMSSTRPVIFTQEVLVNVHDFTGLPWWLTIVLSTVFIRILVTFTLTIYQHQIIAKYQNLMPELEKIKEEMKQEAAMLVGKYHYTEKQARFILISSVSWIINLKM